MNTTAIGDKFEDRVFSLLPRMIEENDIPVPSVHKFFRKKKYKAGEMIVNSDISIEVFSKSHPDKPTQIIIIECKNLGNRLDVSDYQEWMGKIHFMRQSGIKVYFATRNGFPKSVRRSAEKNGFGLIVFSDNEEWDILVPRRYNSGQTIEERFDALCLGNSCQSAPIVYEDNSCKSLPTAIREWGLQPKQENITVPFISEEKIEMVVKILREKIREGYKDMPEYSLWEPLRTTMKLVDDYPVSFLGGYNCLDNSILISSSLVGEFGETPRMRFTMAHELGHCALHRKILVKHFNMLLESNVGDVLVDSDSDAYSRMEWQANTFASYLLMPTDKFLDKVAELFKRYDIHHGKLRLDNQPCNIEDCSKVIKSLSQTFNVSKEAAKIRMIKMNLLEVIQDTDNSLRDGLYSFFSRF